MSSDDTVPLVLDCGSGSIKAGYAEKDEPECIMPYEERLVPILRRFSLQSEESYSLRNDLTNDGLIENWEDMEKMWLGTFEQLKVDPKYCPVLLTEAPHNTPYHREKMGQIMFETFHTPALCIADQAVLSLYSLGFHTGLVFDSGQGASNAVPVNNHKNISHAIIKLDWAGGDLTDFLAELLADRTRQFSARENLDIARNIKETLCYVAEDFDVEKSKIFAKSPNLLDKKYVLPDGHELTVGAEGFQVPEAMFQPYLLGLQSLAMHEAVVCSIMRCEERLRKDLFSHIVLAGGCTLFPGIRERLRKEVITLTPHNTHVHVIAPSKRKNSAWIGGAILASSPLFQHKWISKQEYDEYGSSIMERKHDL